MSASVAPGGSIMAIGLPGTTRTRMKTIKATPNSVTTVEPRRISRFRPMPDQHLAYFAISISLMLRWPRSGPRSIHQDKARALQHTLRGSLRSHRRVREAPSPILRTGEGEYDLGR